MQTNFSVIELGIRTALSNPETSFLLIEDIPIVVDAIKKQLMVSKNDP